MLKFITPQSQDFHGEPEQQLIKFASRGLRGADLLLLQKRAHPSLVAAIEKLAACPDEPLVHMFAIGCTELYSANRNGDGFRKKACRRDHPTFVKKAMFYRDHANTNRKVSFGVVKLSYFNEAMGRIELVAGLNGSEEVARKNGGLLADKEMQKLAKGQPIPVSMASLVPYDVCSFCQNQAKTRKFYCRSESEGGHCKAGGLRSNIGKMVEVDGQLHHLHADNPINEFIDISHVTRPADKTAYVTGVLKVANSRDPSVEDVAEELGLESPDLGWLPRYRHLPPVIECQCKAARHLGSSVVLPSALDLAAFEMLQPLPAPPEPLSEKKLAEYVQALADQQICLPPAAFLEFLGVPQQKAADASRLLGRYLPKVQLSDDHMARSPFAVTGCVVSQKTAVWASSLRESFSQAPADVWQRSVVASYSPVDRPASLKLAGGDSADASPWLKLASAYRLYQVGLIGRYADRPEIASRLVQACRAYQEL